MTTPTSAEREPLPDMQQLFADYYTQLKALTNTHQRIKVYKICSGLCAAPVLPLAQIVPAADVPQQSNALPKEQPALSDERRARIEAALKETAYKYFGYYALSDEQWDAVFTLISAAETLLAEQEGKP